MNKRAIDYDNSQRWEMNRAARLKKAYKQTNKSRQRSKEMSERYSPDPKKLILGLARVKRSKSPKKDLEDKPGWNDKTVVTKDMMKEKLDSRFIRSDYGKENPPKKNRKEDDQKFKMVHQSHLSLQKLREVVNQESQMKGAEVSMKSKLEIRDLQKQMDRENRSQKEYNNYLNEKYEKIEEQKNLNRFLEEQVKVINYHKKDLSKAQALVGHHSRNSSTHSRDRLNKSASKDRGAMTPDEWNDKLAIMKSKAEDKQTKLQYRNNFFQQEAREEEEQKRNALDMYPKRDYEQDQRRSHSRNRSVDSQDQPVRGLYQQQQQQRRNVFNQSQESDHYDKMLEISKQEAWNQYDIHQSLKMNRKEKLVENSNYVNVEQALNTLQERVEPIKIQAEQQKRNAVFSGNLIGRATTKLIKVHHQKIIELLIEDLLLEMVALLTEEEAVKDDHNDKLTRECLMNDYLDEFREMAYEQISIVDRLKEVEASRSNIMTNQFNFRQTTPAEQNHFIINPVAIQVEKVQIELSLGVMVSVFEKRSDFMRKTQKLDHYQKKNMNAFSSITEKLLDEILLSVCKELDDANGQYAELMFQHEFK